MTGITAIYVVPALKLAHRHVALTLRLLAQDCDRLVIVTSADEAELRSDHKEIEPFKAISEPQVDTLVLAGLRRGILHLVDTTDGSPGTIVATSSDVIGPFGGLARHLEAARTSPAEVYAASWTLRNTSADNEAHVRIPQLEFTIFSDKITGTPAFMRLWSEMPVDAFADQSQEKILQFFSQRIERAGWRVGYPTSAIELRTANPGFLEPAEAFKHGAPVLPLSVFHIDPLLHDLNAVELKRALDLMRAEYPEHYGAAMAFALETVPMRDLAMVTDDYAVLPEAAVHPDKSAWQFGTVAVFLHAYYTDMMPHFADLIGNIPAAVHLFVSTSSPKDAQEIEAFLAGHGWAKTDFDVRVVEQNRGRDMSSLFITWRDVILGGDYEVALRLHSKRTPQVPPQVRESFKAHLFDNLIGSRGYVANLLDRIEAERDVGLVVPPLIHIGFATLGHSWFNNKANVARLCEELGFRVPLDDATPVTANGTMFWFRTEALRPMFEHEWRWRDYNAEPHHIDGGLAHSQERLIGYCTQSQGFRTLQVMCPAHAARNYAKLEYKLQRLASHLPLGNIVEQDRLLRDSRSGFGRWLFHTLRAVYATMLSRWPWTRRYLRPVAHQVARILAPGPVTK